MITQQGPDKQPPTPRGREGLEALKALIGERSILKALEVMRRRLGDAFQIPLPGFRAVVVAGPEANRTVLIDGRDRLRWRNARDPVARLLRHGLLVEDGERHDALRDLIAPALHRHRVAGYVGAMVESTDRVAASWTDGSTRDMLVEMRRTALLILTGTLFGVDLAPHLDRLWPSILRALKYISPGLWIVWPGIPRPGYRRALAELDAYLYRIIEERRAAGAEAGDNLLTTLVRTPGLDDGLIRDQLLTMLIAGHDTSTALLAWALYLLGSHPAAMDRARAEVDEVLGEQPPTMERLGGLSYLEQVIKETLRLYPPIHVGNRATVADLEVAGHRVPAGTRLMYSIYLAHRDPHAWDDPDRFLPERFAPERRGSYPPLSYVPFGGGPRHCLGANLAQVEAKAILARLLQTFDLQLMPGTVRPHMGATLEPHPGVRMRVHRRRSR